MLANAAGPIAQLYLLVMGLPKYAFIGTSAWLFLIVNICKIPFYDRPRNHNMGINFSKWLAFCSCCYWGSACSNLSETHQSESFRKYDLVFYRYCRVSHDFLIRY